MEYILKVCAVCIVCAVLSLAVKKQNPEMAVMLGIAGAVGCIWCGMELFQLVRTEIGSWQNQLQLSDAVLLPLVKCLGISVVSQLGVGVCKDAGQSAMASGLELCGNVASAWCLLPLVNHLFGLIGDML